MPANLDKDGHIVITDSMPEEVKQLAARLNSEVDTPMEEEPDILSAAGDDDDDLVDGVEEDDDDEEEFLDDSDEEEVDYTAVSDTENGAPEPVVQETVTSEDLDSLNNMFE